jgi:hypothetical protein
MSRSFCFRSKHRLPFRFFEHFSTTCEKSGSPVPAAEPAEEEEEEATTDYGITPTQLQQQIAQSFQAIQTTIRAYTVYTLSAFKKSCDRQY